MLLVAAILAAILWLPSPWGWAVVLLAALVELAEVAFWVRWNRRRRPQAGPETLPGALGVVLVACEPDGQVRVQGERWLARCAEGAAAGDSVVVRSVDGLTLVVERAERG
ncbi:MAG: NfeD family protein [Thermoleophilia bacterium]